MAIPGHTCGFSHRLLAGDTSYHVLLAHSTQDSHWRTFSKRKKRKQVTLMGIWDQTAWHGIGLLKAGAERGWTGANCILRDHSEVCCWRVGTPRILNSAFSFPSTSFSYPSWRQEAKEPPGVCPKTGCVCRTRRCGGGLRCVYALHCEGAE